MRKTLWLLGLLFCLFTSIYTQTQGELEAVGKNEKSLGYCPLKHTDVRAEISGFLSRVRVTQEFENNFKQPVEAVYVFPLPNDAAVDEMTMKIGGRTIRGGDDPCHRRLGGRGLRCRPRRRNQAAGRDQRDLHRDRRRRDGGGGARAGPKRPAGPGGRGRPLHHRERTQDHRGAAGRPPRGAGNRAKTPRTGGAVWP